MKDQYFIMAAVGSGYNWHRSEQFHYLVFYMYHHMTATVLDPGISLDELVLKSM